MWKRILSVAHRAGFTRNETAVLLFLGMALLVGASLRTLRGGSERPPVNVRTALERQDSLFADHALSPTAGSIGGMEESSGVNADLKTDEEKQPRSAAPLSTASIDINAADARVLDRLPGIGPAMAKRIVEYRDRYGPFGRTEDLLKVKGIGPKKFEQLRQFIIVK